MSNAPTPRVPDEPVRRIDWLAIAPWLLLLRCPGAACHWVVLAGGALLALIAGGALVDGPISGSLEGASASLPIRAVGAAADGLTWPISYVVGGRPSANEIGEPSGWRLVRLLAGLAAVCWFAPLMLRTCAVRLTNHPRRGGRWFRTALTNGPSVLLAAGLILAPVIVLRCGVAVVGWVVAGGAAWIAVIGWPLLLFAATALVLAAIFGALAMPLSVAAIGIERADAFDAASRGIAYATQRLARLVWYVLVAGVVGVASATVLEAVLAAAVMLADGVASPAAGSPIAASVSDFFCQVLRGYYPAYWASATAAIYLLLRRDIDGQPLDEMSD